MPEISDDGPHRTPTRAGHLPGGPAGDGDGRRAGHDHAGHEARTPSEVMASAADRRTVVVVTGGEAPAPGPTARMLAGTAEGSPVVAADSGIEHALRLGLGIDHAVGDFDSVEAAVLAGIEASGTQVVRHPVAKDATDLELALDAAVELGARRVVVLGGHGGRVDHFLGNALVLASPRYANLVVDGVMGSATVHVARPWMPTAWRGEVGEVVTLLPVHGPAEGVVTSGLRFPLDTEILGEGTTRGVSNEMTAPVAQVRLTAGCLLVVRPGSHADRPDDLGRRDPATPRLRHTEAPPVTRTTTGEPPR